LRIFFEYIGTGYTHVIPFGLDHILFILSLYFFSTSFKDVLINCSVFTVAHSLSMAFTIIGFIVPNPDFIEPLITFSILYVSIENIVSDKINRFRFLVIFLFGIIHGFGFANALKEIGLPKSDFIITLFSFNFGVELGQISIIILAYILIVYWFKDKSWYKNRVIYPISSIIGCIALIMTINRVMDVL